jgi:hypothetical protein
VSCQLIKSDLNAISQLGATDVAGLRGGAKLALTHCQTTLITLFTLTMHATHYQTPAAQKQVMRVLMMPCV